MSEKCLRANDPRTSWCRSVYELPYAQRCTGRKKLDLPVLGIKVPSLVEFFKIVLIAVF